MQETERGVVNNHQPHRQDDRKIKESILIKGVAISLQNMILPSVKNVIDLFKSCGIHLYKDEGSLSTTK